MWETWVQSLGWEDPLEEGMATHSSILAWRIPWIEEPGGLTVHGVSRSQTRLKRLSPFAPYGEWPHLNSTWMDQQEWKWLRGVCVLGFVPSRVTKALSPTRCMLFSGVCRKRNRGSHRSWTHSLSPISFPWLSGSRLTHRGWQWFTRWKTKMPTWDMMTLWFCDSVFPSWLLTWMFGTVWGEMVWCFDWCYMLPNRLTLDSQPTCLTTVGVHSIVRLQGL